MSHLLSKSSYLCSHWRSAPWSAERQRMLRFEAGCLRLDLQATGSIPGINHELN
jgi:hypothetical protein